MAKAETKQFLNTKTGCIETTSNEQTIELMERSKQYEAVKEKAAAPANKPAGQAAAKK